MISLTLRKFARFQIENCGRANQSFRMGTNYNPQNSFCGTEPLNAQSHAVRRMRYVCADHERR